MTGQLLNGPEQALKTPIAAHSCDGTAAVGGSSMRLIATVEFASREARTWPCVHGPKFDPGLRYSGLAPPTEWQAGLLDPGSFTHTFPDLRARRDISRGAGQSGSALSQT
jgi:hypothetical protein